MKFYGLIFANLLIFSSFCSQPSKIKRKSKVNETIQKFENEKKSKIASELTPYLLPDIHQIIFDYMAEWEKNPTIGNNWIKSAKPSTNNDSIYTATNGEVSAAFERIKLTNPPQTRSLLNGLPKWFMEFAISYDNKYLATAVKADSIKIYEFNNNLNLYHEIENIGNFIVSLVFSPDSKYLAFATNVAKKIHIWDMASSNYTNILENQESEIKYLIFTPDNRYLISILDDKTVNFYNTSDWQTLKSFELDADGASINVAGISKDCKYMALNFKNSKNILIFDMQRDHWDIIQDLTDHDLNLCVYINHLSFSDDNKYLYISTDRGIKVFRNYFI